jgi:GH15 family glucan-1,4-alpha-glucosidase
MNLSWYWHRRGNSPDDDQWRFLVALVEKAAQLWSEPDSGFWELGEAQHFVFSKAMCWAALDKGIRLAEECMRRAPVERWEATRDEIRAAVESEGYDEGRGIFVQSFGNKELDASLLLMPKMGFIDYADERMIRTTDAIREGLDEGGLIKRFVNPEEGSFVACAFWLVECLARQNRMEEARQAFDRAVGASNDLGLFSEEYDTQSSELLGNFPQGLSHLSHIMAAVALSEMRGEGS